MIILAKFKAIMMGQEESVGLVGKFLQFDWIFKNLYALYSTGLSHSEYIIKLLIVSKGKPIQS